MISLCDKNECVGCEACINACESESIKMIADEKGFIYPDIDYDKCIGCRRCMNVCPVITPKETKQQNIQEIYACINKSDKITKISSSGGFFSDLASWTIGKGGTVYGAAYNTAMEVAHIRIDKHTDINPLRRSKYIQSKIGNTFNDIKKDLKDGKYVLFSGTPCQVSGLHGFLNGKIYDKLILCDFICHGVPSPMVWKDYLKWLDCGDIKDINFRDKSHGWRNPIMTCTNENGLKILKGKQKCFYHAFIEGITVRPSCFKCPAKPLPQNSDFTLGDFWGIEKNMNFEYKEFLNNGVSAVFINTEKGKDIFSQLDVFYQNMEYKDVIHGNIHIEKSLRKPLDYELFWKEYQEKNFEYVCKKYMRPNIKQRIIDLLKDNLSGQILTILRKI